LSLSKKSNQIKDPEDCKNIEEVVENCKKIAAIPDSLIKKWLIEASKDDIK